MFYLNLHLLKTRFNLFIFKAYLFIVQCTVKSMLLSEYLLFYIEQRKSYRFGKTQGGENDDRIKTNCELFLSIYFFIDNKILQIIFYK